MHWTGGNKSLWEMGRGMPWGWVIRGGGSVGGVGFGGKLGCCWLSWVGVRPYIGGVEVFRSRALMGYVFVS